MDKLLAGVREFHRQMNTDASRVYEPLAEGQQPNTLFIACADSRVVPAFIATAEPGELFTLRNVGNLVPPADAGGASVGDLSEASAIEYAVQKLAVTDIVVCGHSGCGAMAALLEPSTTLPRNLAAWLTHAAPVLDDALFPRALGEGLPLADKLSRRNVVLQIAALRTYPQVRAGLAAGTLRLHGWWFDIRATCVDVYAPEAGRFVAFEQAYGALDV